MEVPPPPLPILFALYSLYPLMCVSIAFIESSNFVSCKHTQLMSSTCVIASIVFNLFLASIPFTFSEMKLVPNKLFLLFALMSFLRGSSLVFFLLIPWGGLGSPLVGLSGALGSSGILVALGKLDCMVVDMCSLWWVCG